MKSLILSASLLLSLSAFAEGEKKVSCVAGSDTKILEIKAKDKGCELTYTKGGEAKVVATQKVGFSKCEEIAKTIQDKLTASNYKCD